VSAPLRDGMNAGRLAHAQGSGQGGLPAAPAPHPPIHVVCLCAAWCQLCDSYRAVFEEVCRRVGQHEAALRSRWIDIEDEAELCGELDIETFPTLLVCQAGAVRFAGALTPQASTLERALRAALAGPPVSTDAAFAALAARLG